MLYLFSSEEEAHYCEVTIECLRREVYSYNNDLFLLDQRLDDQLHPPCAKERAALDAVKARVLRRRQFSAKLIQGIREVVLNPPSLEARVFGWVARVLSFRYV
jgi:hypothetical protein